MRHRGLGRAGHSKVTSVVNWAQMGQEINKKILCHFFVSMCCVYSMSAAARLGPLQLWTLEGRGENIIQLYWDSLSPGRDSPLKANWDIYFPNGVAELATTD